MAQEEDSFLYKLRSLLRRHAPKHGQAQEKIEQLIEEAQEQGLISEEENDLLSSILDFTEKTVDEIMVPRPEIVGVGLNDPLADVIRIFIESGHTRLPVFSEDLDHIDGLFYAKDLLKYWSKPDEEINLHDLLREPYLIPESKPIDELLRDFQRKRLHIALVIDEYGGTAGLVTLEDIIEEVFGEISDEYDKGELKPERTKDGSLVVNPRIELDDIEELVEGADAPEGDFTTLGGWILEVTGRIPGVGETIELGSMAVKILDADEKRIIKVKLIPRSEHETEEAL